MVISLRVKKLKLKTLDFKILHEVNKLFRLMLISNNYK